ncbi:MAG: CinA family protein, partial [Oscillospiraceae bacterium]
IRKEVKTLIDFADDNKSVTKALDNTAKEVVSYLLSKGITLSTAESCTGGMVSQAITSVSGASRIYMGGVCSYNEQIKVRVLGVDKATLERHTVYSPEVASEMSLGVMKLMETEAAIGITGIAGPDGGTAEKPVGTVYVSVRYGQKENVRNLMLYKEYKKPDRNTIRLITSVKALEMLKTLVENTESEDE